MTLNRIPPASRPFPPTIALCAAVFLAACGDESGDSGAWSVDHLQLISQIESGLLPAVEIEGETTPPWTLTGRMEYHQVPGVSIAVIEGGELVWARGWGLADPDLDVPVSQETIFQAASISKPVAALTALSLVEEGLLELDGPVNDYLTSWNVPDSEFSADSVVTLRHLLTHSAGLTVWGFPGYRKDEPFNDTQEVASNVQVLSGEGNTDPVELYKEPGISWQYSGGGYTVMEQLIEDVTGMPFPDVANQRVLEPLRLYHSTYQQPLPQDRWDQAARAHTSDGTEVEGEWHTYPEQAAAGLWTTPGELAEISIHLLRILDGTVTDGILSRDMVEEMLSPNHDGAEGYSNWGLGFGLSAPGEPRRFGHGGSNAGFKANWVVYRDSGQGYAIMTNGDRGSTLAGEIGRAIARAYDWPEGQPEVKSRVRPDPSVFEEVSGEYVLEGMEDFVITLSEGGDATLEVDVPGQGVMVFYASPTADEWFETSDGDVMVFERDADGTVVGATNAGTTVLIKR